jgi:ribosomal protein S18 acetylase RimI-like enzyme
MLLRRAFISDSQAIADLEQILFPDNWMSPTTIATTYDQGPCFALTHGPLLMGYILTSYDGGLIDILRVGVSDSCRRLGWGQAMLEKVLTSRHRRAMLTVQPGNTPALRLYKKLGFVFYGQLPQGAWVLTRTSLQTTDDRS